MLLLLLLIVLVLSCMTPSCRSCFPSQVLIRFQRPAWWAGAIQIFITFLLDFVTRQVLP